MSHNRKKNERKHSVISKALNGTGKFIFAALFGVLLIQGCASRDNPAVEEVGQEDENAKEERPDAAVEEQERLSDGMEETAGETLLKESGRPESEMMEVSLFADRPGRGSDRTG